MDHLPIPCLTPSTEQRKNSEYAIKKTREMLGYFRKGEANDPIRYPLAIAEVLSCYPTTVIDAVTSVHGIASASDWMPSVHEVRQACEARRPRDPQPGDHFHIKPMRFVPPGPPQPTIFTAEHYPRYDQLKARHDRGEGPARLENHECADKTVRYGIMTPLHWITG